MKLLPILCAALCLSLSSCVSGFRAVNTSKGTFVSDTTDSTGRTEVWGPNGFHVIRDVTQDASTVNRETIKAIGNAAAKLGFGAASAVLPVR